MRVIFVPEAPTPVTGPSIFLAGPTPRDRTLVKSWRPEALEILRQQGFSGTVFVPETKEWGWLGDDAGQIEWEEAALRAADVILFWIPRNMTTFPGMTTNIEFGQWKESGKIVVGCPPTAEKVSYILYYCNKLGIPQAKTLRDTIAKAALHLSCVRQRWASPPKKYQRALGAVNLLIPHPTRQDHLLFLRRANSGWRDGWWNLPAGHIDEGESPLQALVREAREELDISVSPKDCLFVGVSHHPAGPQERHAYVDYYFLVGSFTGDVRLADDKADALEWYPPQQLPAPLTEHAHLGITLLQDGRHFETHGW